MLTTQFYFDDDFNAKVFEGDAYASAAGRDSFNDSDGIYDRNLELTLSDEETATSASSRSTSRARSCGRRYPAWGDGYDPEHRGRERRRAWRTAMAT
ncbi:MAG: hypothetical protein ABWY65_02790 [Thermoleophilaceae bacterium]